MKLPSLQFYPGDWLRDSVAGCSLAAQGLWLRMMFLMHDSERYGYLQQNGKPIPSESIARRCGCTPDEYLTLLSELDDTGIPSRTSDGILFSRRMVRDASERNKNADRQRRFRRNHNNESEGSDEVSSNASDNAHNIGRSNADVTGLSRASSSSVSSSPSASRKISSNLSGDAAANGANAPDTPPNDFTVLGYFAYLKTLPAFDHIDPEGEASLVKLWHEKPKNRKRRITKRFLEDWAKRVERPLVEESPPNGAKVAANVPPELSPDELQTQVSVVAGMLEDGRTLPEIHAQIGGAIRQSQWGQIASAARAQAKLPKLDTAGESPPPPSANVVNMPTRMHAQK